MVGILAAAALILFCAAAMARYLAPTLAIDWADETVVMLFVWAMLLIGYRLTLDRAHIRVDLLTCHLSPLWRRRAETASACLLALYAAGLTFSGTLVARDALLLGERTESTARIPVFIYFASLPVGMALVGWAASRLLAGFRGRECGRDDP
jgi:TRAP-type C4-dicarboxylate transport system permease small subunit